jgi:DNA topoisomerase-1
MDREYVIKEGKFLRPTPLGEVVTGLMKDRFSDIVDLKFTARMEETLDSVESGAADWREVLSSFYGGFASSIENAEEALEGERLKVPDELSDETCDVCGRQLVIKSGRFGRFLACPGYPECTFTKPIVVEMPGKCPTCGGKILKRTSKNGYTYYGCENMKVCNFLTWDVPVADNCPECGQTLFKKAGRGSKKPFCVNEKCSLFVPEDRRGGYKKKTEDSEKTGETPDGESAPEGTKKSAAKKSAAGAAKKPAAKKSAAKPKKTTPSR